ncbi:SDR family oxidoreductase [Microbacterium sp.]|uniref:SDR family NAD(P)-dependent oxidoreductase n=1 Tax=Microbacterium sp. TaxID=51671 RepID=UPI0028118E4B|nr:SDR family oxidoreductase [Microbacterium sp.]
MATTASFVVTGGARGIGWVIAQHLAAVGPVVVLDTDAGHSEDPRIRFVQGDVASAEDAVAAARLAEESGPLTGWVNNAAVFRDAGLATASADEISSLVRTNLDLAIVGCHTAVQHFLTHSRAGSIVNVSSHQAQRPVRGALPYATAKAAIEGLTRAAAVDHGPHGIRVNAVALGSVATARYEGYRSEHPEADRQIAALHPIGRIGQPQEVAEAVEFLLSAKAAFITGTVLPVDGGRAALGLDPEAV